MQALKESNKVEVFYLGFNNLAFSSKNLFVRLISLGSIVFNVKSFFKTYKVVRINKIDIVHTHNFFYMASPSVFWAIKLARAKVVQTIHNYRIFCLAGTFFYNGKVCQDCIYSNIYKSGIKRACFKNSYFASAILAFSNFFNKLIGTWNNKIDAYLVLTPFVKEIFCQSNFKIDSNKIIVRPNHGANIGFIPITERDNFFLYIGRISEEKGIFEMLNYWANRKEPLIIAGTGESVQEEKLKKLIQGFPESKIQFIGKQDAHQVANLLKKCKALIFPSIWFEGMPMILLEAMSTGAMILMKENSNLKSLIVDKYNGLVYSNKNHFNKVLDEIAIFESPNLYISIQRQAYHDYEANYAIKNAAASLEKIYENLIKIESSD